MSGQSFLEACYEPLRCRLSDERDRDSIESIVAGHAPLGVETGAGDPARTNEQTRLMGVYDSIGRPLDLLAPERDGHGPLAARGSPPGEGSGCPGKATTHPGKTSAGLPF